MSNSCTWQMWRNLKFLHMSSDFKFLHMSDVEKSEISFNMCTIYGILLHLHCFVGKFVFFWRFTLFCRKIGLLQFTRFCVEKILAKNSACGEKMTNIRYGVNVKTSFQWKVLCKFWDLFYWIYGGNIWEYMSVGGFLCGLRAQGWEM